MKKNPNLQTSEVLSLKSLQISSLIHELKAAFIKFTKSPILNTKKKNVKLKPGPRTYLMSSHIGTQINEIAEILKNITVNDVNSSVWLGCDSSISVCSFLGKLTAH